MFYVFLRTPKKDRWGVLIPEDHPLAKKAGVTPKDLIGVPLIMSGREIVIHELASWFGDLFDQVEIAATFNLVLNAANMVKNGLGAATCFLKIGIQHTEKTDLQYRHPKGWLYFCLEVDRMTQQEASEHYNIPVSILQEYESWGLCGAIKR